jgi:hypothetical protein
MNILRTLFLLTAFALTARAQKVKIDFDRPSKAGEKRQCEASASYEQKYTIVENGKKSAQSIRKAELSIAGQMLILETIPNGNPGKVEFTFTSAKGALNGKPHPLPLDGKTLLIDLTKQPVCGFELKGGKADFSKTDIALLSLVFRPASPWTIKDLMGTEKAVAPNATWPAPAKEILKQMDIKELKTAKPKGFVKFEGTEEFKGIKCQKLTEEIYLKSKDLLFSFKATVLLPADTKQSAVKISRKGSQRSTKKLPQNDPLAGDKTITIEITDQLEATALP